MNDYRKMMERIDPPEGLDRRVLTAARAMRQSRKPSRPVWRLAVCAACAVALVAGSVSLRMGRNQSAIAERTVPVLDGSLAKAGANGGLVFLRAEEELAGSTVELTVKRETKSYYLTTEKLRTFLNEDGSSVLVPVLAGDREEVSGLYAVPEDSDWLLWPVEGSSTVSLSAPYGEWVAWSPDEPDKTGFHSGIDIPGERGFNILAAEDGTVTEVGFDAERGNYLVLDHGDGLTTLYGQCQEVLVQEGDAVQGGEVIALLGSTGMATGPHLHFEVRRDGKAQNPVAYFDAELRDTLKMG